MPTWEDYLALAFDEIRQFGATLVRVMRRLRSALAGLMESTTISARSEAAQRYIKHLDLAIDHSTLDAQDQTMARHEDRQGLGLSQTGADLTALLKPTAATSAAAIEVFNDLLALRLHALP
jgi:uncharacterized membrane protein